MWSELELHAKIRYCVCGNCKCGVGDKIINMMKEEKAHQFLMGLNDETFSTIRSQVLALDPLPVLDTIYNMIQQVENHKRVMMAHDHVLKIWWPLL